MPFVLYWTNNSRLLTYEDIFEVDSIKTNVFLHFKPNELKSIYDPVVLLFEDRNQSNIYEPIDTHTEYRLFTYLNNTKYYLALGSGFKKDDDETLYKIVLNSEEINRDIIKGDR